LVREEKEEVEKVKKEEEEERTQDVLTNHCRQL
jgi:hypothetical protein